MQNTPSITTSGIHRHPFRQRYQLIDVWNAARTERNFDYVFWGHITLNILMDEAVKLFGRCLVIVAVVLILALVSIGFFIVLPNITTTSSIWFYFHAIFGNSFNIDSFSTYI